MYNAHTLRLLHDPVLSSEGKDGHVWQGIQSKCKWCCQVSLSGEVNLQQQCHDHGLKLICHSVLRYFHQIARVAENIL